MQCDLPFVLVDSGYQIVLWKSLSFLWIVDGSILLPLELCFVIGISSLCFRKDEKHTCLLVYRLTCRFYLSGPKMPWRLLLKVLIMKCQLSLSMN